MGRYGTSQLACGEAPPIGFWWVSWCSESGDAVVVMTFGVSFSADGRFCHWEADVDAQLNKLYR